MIIYKPWRYTYIKDAEIIIIDYVGYWLFGIIPLFLRKISKTHCFNDEGGNKLKLEEGVYQHMRDEGWL